MGDYGPAIHPLHSTPVGNPSHPEPTPNEISVLVTGFGVSTDDLRGSFEIRSENPSIKSAPSGFVPDLTV